MGSRYWVIATAQYTVYSDTGTHTEYWSEKVQASCVVTSPVTVKSTLPARGRRSTRSRTHKYYLRSYLSVPGTASQNGPDKVTPKSWSAQLVAKPEVRIYMRRWSSAKHAYMYGYVRTATASFADGYPAACTYAFSTKTAGRYRLAITGRLISGFVLRGSMSTDIWQQTRYITMK